MFNFDYAKAKKTFRSGIITLLSGLVIGCFFIIPIVLIIKLVKDAPAALVFVLIVIGVAIAITIVVGLVLTIYGGVVYHAERTATRDVKEPKPIVKAENKKPTK